MKQHITITFGKLENRGTKKERFAALMDGEDLQVVIVFDDASVIGYCKLSNLQQYIAESIHNYELLPDRSQY